jgi:hypothetical protein
VPLWIAWLRDHWLSFALLVGVIIAIAFVFAKRKLLFYKE